MQLGQVIGKGSSGVVLRGRCMGQAAAVKLMHSNDAFEEALYEATIYQVGF